MPAVERVLKWQLRFESELFLREIAESDHDHRSYYFGYGRINMASFYEKLHEAIVEDETNHYQHQVTEQLYSAAQTGVVKYDGTH